MVFGLRLKIKIISGLILCKRRVLFHFCQERQVEKVADFQDRDIDETLVLMVDEDKLKAELRYEGDKEEFPHLYDSLNLDAIVSVESLDQFLH